MDSRGIFLSERIKKDRLFFHDIINQTHGIQLFLKHKISSNCVIEIEDAKLISKEINILQTLIRDHFNLEHKDLGNISEYVQFQDTKKVLDGMLSTYLSGIELACDYSGLEYSCELHTTSFYRIMTNLLKNISESKSTKVKLSFIVSELGLQIFAENQIQFGPKHGSGVGLESTRKLCIDNGGTFEFKIIDEFWISEVFLPTKKVVSRQAA